jgi:hypothetical protein
MHRTARHAGRARQMCARSGRHAHARMFFVCTYFFGFHYEQLRPAVHQVDGQLHVIECAWLEREILRSFVQSAATS